MDLDQGFLARLFERAFTAHSCDVTFGKGWMTSPTGIGVATGAGSEMALIGTSVGGAA